VSVSATSLRSWRESARTGARGSLARGADRFGMWMLLRERYGTNYALEPHQFTRVSLDPYLALCAEADRERLFPAARPPRDVRLRAVEALLDDPESRALWVPRGLDPTSPRARLLRQDFTFPSPHRALSTAFEAQLATTPENATVHGRLYTAEGVPPRSAVVVVHGFAARSLDSVARFLPAELMASRGIAAALVMLPYHGPRTPAAARFSGELFMSGDVARTFEAVLQAVADLRATVAWLQDALGIERVGLIGGSLGGYLATLTAAVEPRLAVLFAIAPPVRITESIDIVPLGRYARAGLERQRMPREVMHRLQDLVDPSCLRPALPVERMCFIAGRNDLFVPALHMQRLVERWQGVRVLWHDWGHITTFAAWRPSRLFREIAGFAQDFGL
jgi:dienelactone hydrolase